MTLIKPNTLVSFVDGSPFYGTAHKWSDIDIISVELKPLDKFLSGIKTSVKQKHGMQWAGKSVDITRYEVDHFLNLITKGNIQMIEKVLKAKDEHFVYRSTYWESNESLFKILAKNALNFTTWGHIKGWMHKTINKVEIHGMDVKKAILMYRFIIEARTFMTTGEFVCQYPELISYAKDEEEKNILRTLYEYRLEGKSMSGGSLLRVESKIFAEVEKITEMFDTYEPKEKRRPMLFKDGLMHMIRSDQIRTAIRNGSFRLMD